MTINYYLERRNKRKNPELLIQLFVRIKGKLLKIGTGEKILNKHWDKETQRPLKNSPGAELLTDLLDSWEEEIKSVSREARILRKTVNIEYLKSHLSFITKRDHSFFGIWDKWITEESNLSEWTKSTIGRYDGCKKKLQEIDKSNKVEFDSLGNDFLQRFIKHHRNKANSYTEKNLVIMKGFLNWCVLHDYSSNLDYKKWKPKFKQAKVKDNIVSLSVDELVKLTKMEIEDQTLGEVRDVFCFGCYTGLRHSDLLNLKKTDIFDDHIKITTIKTTDPLKIELNIYAKAIWEKYKNLPGDFALPAITGSNANKYLKQIGKQAGLNEKITTIKFTGNKRTDEISYKWQKLSTHVARRTYISIAVYLGIGIEIVMANTGQTRETIERYFKIDDKQKAKEMKKFNHLKVV